MTTDGLANLSPDNPADASVAAAAWPADLAACHAMIAQLLEQLTNARRENAQLEHQLQQVLRRLYGRSSERIDPNQMALFAEMLQQLQAQQPSAQEAPVPPTAAPAPKPSNNGHGRRRLPADFPRERIELDLPENEKPCPCCGKMRQRIGQEVSEKLDYVPAKVKVIQTVRPKYACRDCDAAGHGAQIAIAELPSSPIEKGLAAPGLLAAVIVGKYSDHRVQGKAVLQMRAGLSWPGDRARPQTSPDCGGQEPSWETSGAKGATRSRQVRSAKSNASEPLMTCRNSIPSTSKPGRGDCPGMSMGGACNPAHAASGTKAARARIRLGHGTLEPVASMLREKPKRTTRKGESTDARHRGGTTRSSDERRVMRLERRGRVIQSSDNRPTVQAGGAHG